MTTIHQRMVSILGELPAIGKTEQAPADMGGYAFRGIAAIVATLKPLLAKHGVFVTPTTIERRDTERAVGRQRDRTMFVTDVHVDWRFYGEEGDSVICSTWGQGSDMGDKATQKAYTAAFKSMLAEVFCIADSETDSERHSVPETQRTLNWFEANGWDGGQEEHDAERAAIIERIKALPDEKREWVKAQMAENDVDLGKAITPQDRGVLLVIVDEAEEYDHAE